MYNYNIDITAKKREVFDEAVRLAFGGREFATHFKIEPPGQDCSPAWVSPLDRNHGARLFLMWNEADGAQPLPFPLTAEEAAHFLWAWLQKLTAKDYRPRPDMDGDVEEGAWRVRTRTRSAWDYGILDVEPQWAEYPK